MKKHILYLLALFIGLNSFAQTAPPSYIRNQKVIIENQTGDKVSVLEVKGAIDSVTKRVSVADLRAMSGRIITASKQFYTTDKGKEGFWTYDSSDGVSADNTGTILVTADGKRLKRVLKEAGVFEANWFGVVADGQLSSAPLNRSALVSALNVAGAAGGGVVMVPKGVTLINRPDNSTGSLIQPQSNVILKGYGRDVSIIKKADNINNPFVLADTKSNFQIRDLGFDGGTQTVSAVSIQLNNCFNFIIENCRFTNMKSAVWLNGSGANTCHDFQVMNCWFDSTVDFGVRAKENNPYNGLIFGNTFVDITQGIAVAEYSAIRISGINITVSTNTILSTVDTGIMFTRSVNCTAENNNISSNLVGIFAGTQSTGLKIINNTITSLRDFGIHAYNPENVIFNAAGVYTGNKIYNTGKSGMYFDASSGNTIVGNNVLNPGRRIDLEDREKCGINLGSNSSAVRSTNNTVTGNVVIDDLSNQRMKYGIFEETATASNYILSNVVLGSTGDEVRSTTNTFDIGTPRIRQSKQLLQMSTGLGVGEVLTSTRPDPTLTGKNVMLWDNDYKRHIFSDGTTWENMGSRTFISTGTTANTKDQLNSAFPNAKKGDKLIKDVAGVSYTKKDDLAAGDWSVSPSLQVPATGIPSASYVYGIVTTKTASGTGSTVVTIPHGYSGITTSSNVFVQAKNAPASNIQYVTIDATNININYSVAPVVGTSNLTYSIFITP